ncbi:MAG: decaprenyl-phosphate phosphoribosyltransferase [Ktedonobacterales bacterium]
MSVPQSPPPALDRPPPPAPAGARRSTPARAVTAVRAAVEAMRPGQWSKNGLVLLALIFARRLTDPAALGRVAVAFVAFCFASSAVYVLNDIADRQRDRLHPRKRFRPVASGRLALPLAAATAAVCAGIALILTLWLALVGLRGLADPFAAWGGSPLLLTLTVAGYLVINVAYSYKLKHVVLWDVFIIAAGFVLRALAGAFAIPVPISPWFYLCTTFLALLLALGKRRAELVALGAEAGAEGAKDVEGARGTQRDTLRRYTVQLLDQLLAVVVTCTLITYSLYTFQGEAASHALMVTIPFVVFGIFRYLYLLYVRGDGERPDELLWRDRQILGSVVLCVLAAGLLLYVFPH